MKDLFGGFRVIPVVTLKNVEDAVPVAKALCDGGLPCAEITFRTAAAEDCIKAILKEFPDMYVGAGTVLTKEQADRAIDAGVKFVVAPGFNAEIVKHCQSRGVPMIPGVCTPTEIEAAMSIGLDTLKFFPAEAAGGVKMLKAMSAPYGAIKFMPTGGISLNNLSDYLSLKCVACCGGSWIVPGDLVTNKDFDAIKKIAEDTCKFVADFDNK